MKKENLDENLTVCEVIRDLQNMYELKAMKEAIYRRSLKVASSICEMKDISKQIECKSKEELKVLHDNLFGDKYDNYGGGIKR